MSIWVGARRQHLEPLTDLETDLWSITLWPLGGQGHRLEVFRGCCASLLLEVVATCMCMSVCDISLALLIHVLRTRRPAGNSMAGHLLAYLLRYDPCVASCPHGRAWEALESIGGKLDFWVPQYWEAFGYQSLQPFGSCQYAVSCLEAPLPIQQWPRSDCCI